MHGKGKRTEAAHARAARASEGHGRALLPCAFLLALVALLMAPTRAYADGANYRTVLWSGDYASGKQYIVGADNKYDAAAYICGQTSAQVAAYDLTVRYKLSATENDFAALADSLEKDWPGWNEDTLSQSLAETFSRDVNGITLWQEMTSAVATTGTTVGLKPFGTYLDLIQVNYWQNNVDCDIYAVDTTSDAVSRARDDLEEILNGGGAGGDTGNNYVFTSNTKYNERRYSSFNDYLYADLATTGIQYTANNYYCSGNAGDDGTYTLFGSTFTVQVAKEYVPDTFVVGENTIAYVQYYRGNPKYVNLYNGVTCNYANNTFVNTNSYIASIQYTDAQMLSISIPTGNSYWTFDGSVFTINYDDRITPSITNLSSHTTYAGVNEQIALYSGSGGGSDPDPPSGPGNWPDPPSNPNPEPPTVPDPPQNPEPDPPSTPVAPTPPPLEPPTNVMIPTGTTAADYTPWLRAILEQLQTLTDELASHCVHLQEEMQTSVNELQDTLIYRLNSLESQIWDLFNGLEDYLHDLAAWLAEQLNFNVNNDPYDDSSVLYWLRQIYSRLGNLPKSPTTVMDPDPTEPFDFWAWLMNLIANTVGGIIGDLVGDVAGLLDHFKDKFPFSIPWDIAALLTLLDGTRATPAFDVKLAAVPGWWQETTFRIDLAPFDSVASACRTMVNILWVMVLVMKTDWMLAIMGDATSFGERFARKVARTS